MPVATTPGRPDLQTPRLQPLHPLPDPPEEGDGDGDGDGGCGCSRIFGLRNAARALLAVIGLHAAWQAAAWSGWPLACVSCGVLALLAWACLLRR